ncbi:hypothetical protein [Alkalihalobacterium bogoriense]|uniref:hypothetical protein n=1 Tax=Alkalihalobacterium bogoriense TaxID=246272 RepID=UPI00047AACA7|nr:hypothetical protein [Alkalihalobacterium bogoriense]
MYILLIFVFAVCLFSLIFTLSLTKTEDTEYTGKKSLNNQLWIYVILLPIIVIVLLLVCWLFIF